MTQGPRRIRVRATIAVAVTAGLVLVGSASPASAHAYLDRTEPSDGTTMQHSPEVITLDFSEEVLVHDTGVAAVNSHGKRFTATGIVSTHTGDTESPMQLRASLPKDLPPDAYRIEWHTVSADDLHRTSGEFVIGVGRPVLSLGSQEDPAADPIEALLRWVSLLLLAVLIGGMTVNVLAARRRLDGTEGVLLRPRTWLTAGAAATALALALPAEQLWRGTQATRIAGPLLTGPHGHRVLAHTLALALLTAAAWAVGRRPSRPRLAGAGAAFLLVAATEAMLGHAGSARPLSEMRVASLTVHVCAATLWLGILLACADWHRSARGAAESRQDLQVVLRRIAWPAAGSVGLLVVTGLTLTGRGIASADGLLFSHYGRALLLKLALVGVAMLIGGLNHRAVRRPAGTELEPGLIFTEALTLTVVVAASAVLAAAQPARGPAWNRPLAGRPDSTLSKPVADLMETVTIQPNRPGRNIALVGVFDTRRPAPAPVTAVEVTLVAAGERRTSVATRTPAGSWAAPLSDVPHGGSWNLEVVVRRPGLEPVVLRNPWRIGADATAHRVRVSDAPLRPWTDRLAVAGLAVLLLVGGALMPSPSRARTRGHPLQQPVT